MSARKPAELLCASPRLALTQAEAARALGVSSDFFQQYLRHEIPCIRRGRRRIYPVTHLQRWLDQNAAKPTKEERWLA